MKKLTLIRSQPKSRADMVLSRAKSHDTVDCWSDPQTSQLQLALFLQFHDGNTSTPVGDCAARATFAYRNMLGDPIRFTRELVCSGGELEEYEAGEELRILPGRRNGKHLREGVLALGVVVRRAAGEASIRADVTFCDGPQPAAVKGHSPSFDVMFPDERTECACCSTEYGPV